MIIMTDGLENASREFTKTKIKELINSKIDIDKWQFNFLGTGFDAFAEAALLGIPVNSSLQYEKETKTSGGILLASKNITKMRSMSSFGTVVDSSYSNEERESVQ